MREMQWAGGAPHARHLPSLSPKPISAFGGRPPSQWRCRRDRHPTQGWSSLFSETPRTSSPREAAPSQLGCCQPPLPWWMFPAGSPEDKAEEMPTQGAF